MPDTDLRLTRLLHPESPERAVLVRIERSPDAGDGPLPVVLVMHGFKGFMHWGFFPELSRRIAAAGMVCVSLNASGSGIGEELEEFTEEEAFAKNTFSRELEDLDLVRAFVDEELEGLDRERRAIFGHSRGGGMVLLHAARRGDYRAVVTWSAIDSVDRFDDEVKRQWREQGHILVHNARTGQDHRIDLDLLQDVEANREALDILAACGRLQTATLVVHGSADPGVPVAASERIAAALPNARHLAIEGAGHTFGATLPFAGSPPELERAFAATLDHLTSRLQ